MRKLIFLILVFFLSVRPAAAISQFTTDYEISYQVRPSGKTLVRYQIDQTNNLSRVYATDFSLSVSHTNLENLKVKDFNSKIDPEVIVTNNITSINFSFKNKIVGKNKTHKFSIEYETSDIASQTGLVWEINIPKITAKETINNLKIVLQVPDNFPKPAFMDPKPSKVLDNSYIFSSEMLANKPISAIFGNQQFFKLDANFYLKNELSGKTKKTIALPPNTSYQDVFINKINPQPDNITIDQDGNWLASYTLKPKQEINVFLQQTIKLNFVPRQERGTADMARYLEPTKIWDFNSPDFSSASLSELKTPQQIFDFVTNSLIYNYSLVRKDPLSRDAASFSIRRPTQAICTNFTDLFIALSRRAGIPAREIQGFAMSKNDKLKPLSLSKDVLHAWPEYFDKKKNTWIQVDPTWANTTNGVDYFNKLDLNHITFVIHGQDSVYPLPAGFYKNPKQDNKDVKVTETRPVAFPPASIKIELLEQKGNKLKLRLSNSSGSAARSSLKATISNKLIKTQPLNIPPLSYKDISLDLISRPVLGKTTKTLNLEINGSVNTLPVTIKPIFQIKTLLLILFTLVVLLFLIIKKIKKSNSVFPVSIKT